MIKLKKILVESPDEVITKSLKTSYKSPDAYTFGYDNDELYIKKTHVVKRVNGKTSKTLNIHYDLIPNVNRKEMKFPGRIWIKHNVISFWGEYPSPTELAKIYEDISKELEININKDTFLINVIRSDDEISDDDEDTSQYIPEKNITYKEYKMQFLQKKALGALKRAKHMPSN